MDWLFAQTMTITFKQAALLFLLSGMTVGYSCNAVHHWLFHRENRP